MKRSIAPLFALFGMLALPLAADEPADTRQSEVLTLLERIDDAMLGIRSNLQSARMKFRNGVVDGGGSEDSEPTPMRECCRGNLTRMQKRSEEMRGVASELRDCYQRESNHDGTSALGLFRMDHEQLDTGVQEMVGAPTRDAADGIIQLMIQAYLQLKRSRDALPACPAVAEDEAQGTDGDGKNDDKNDDKAKSQ